MKELLIAQSKDTHDSELFNYVYASMISSDTLTTPEECDKSIISLNIMKEAIDEVEAPENRKRRWYQLVEDGLYICNRDKMLMEREKENSK